MKKITFQFSRGVTEEGLGKATSPDLRHFFTTFDVIFLKILIFRKTC